MTSRAAILFPALLGALSLAGCSWLSPEPKEATLKGSSKEEITLGELEKEVRDLADRSVMRLGEACDQIKQQAPTWEARRHAHLIKVRAATSVYDAVTSGDILEELLDLTAMIELAAVIWVDDRVAERLFGAALSRPLITSFEGARKEAWALAARALNRKQQERLKSVIRDWRDRNPTVDVAAFIRFNSGAGDPAGSLLKDIRGSLGGILDPFRSTTQSVDATRYVAERAFYYSKRLPMLLNWEAEATAGQVVDLSRMEELLTDVSMASTTIARLPDEARNLVLQGFLAAAGLIVLTFLLAGVYKNVSFRLYNKSKGQPKSLPR
ncbi:MAG: hypothetical protein EHM91_05680 [Planctomycetota bacterium]|nr:MAG: hypothetical protein EHM91_05680 [Planctomycetota bacterium]